VSAAQAVGSHTRQLSLCLPVPRAFISPRYDRSTAFHAAGRPSGRPGAPEADNSPEPAQSLAGIVRVLQVSREDVLEHLLFRRQVGHQASQPGILLDHLIVWSEAHLRRVLIDYATPKPPP
jgi:hypothetical protein